MFTVLSRRARAGVSIVWLCASCLSVLPAGAQGNSLASPPSASAGGASYTPQGPKDWYPRLSGLPIQPAGTDAILVGGIEYESRTCLVTFFSNAPADLVREDLARFATEEERQSQSSDSYYLTLSDAKQLFTAVDFYNDRPEVRGAALIPTGPKGTVSPPTALGPVTVSLGGGASGSGGGEDVPSPVDLPSGGGPTSSGGGTGIPPAPSDGSTGVPTAPSDGSTGVPTPPTDGSTIGSVSPGGTGATPPPSAGAGGATDTTGGGAGSGVSSPPASMEADSGSLWPGDINGDYQVSVSDVIHILRAAIGLETLSGLAAARADINRSGSIDVGDAILALGLSVGNGLPPPYGYPG